MHIGHSHDELDHESLAMRHLGEGVFKEQAGLLQEALSEYKLAHELDPSLEIARLKLAALSQRLGRIE